MLYDGMVVRALSDAPNAGGTSARAPNWLVSKATLPTMGSQNCSMSTPFITILAWHPRSHDLQFRPRARCECLLDLRCIPLRPLSHQLPLYLPRRQFRNLVNKCNATDQLLVLRNLRLHPILDLFGCDFALCLLLQRNVCTRVFFVVHFDTDSGGIGDRFVLEEDSF